jgi:Fic/DOC family
VVSLIVTIWLSGNERFVFGLFILYRENYKKWSEFWYNHDVEKVKVGTENREKQGEKLADFLSRIDAFNFFKKLKTDTELSEKVTFDEFKDFLVRINGIARNIPIQDRGFDGNGVALDGFIDQAVVPKQEDKEDLLKEAFMARLRLKYPEDDRYMLPAVLTAVHPFADGNGRTSRVLNLLLTEYDSSEKFNETLQKALGEDGRFDSLDINPSYINLEIEKTILRKYGLAEDQLPDGLTRARTNENPQSDSARNFFKKYNADSRYCFIAMYKYLQSRGKLEAVVKTKADFPTFNLEDDYKAISPLKMEEIFTQEDWDGLLNEYYEKVSIETLIDIFVNPDDYKSDESGLTLREQLIEKAKQNLLDNQL